MSDELDGEFQDLIHSTWAKELALEVISLNSSEKEIEDFILHYIITKLAILACGSENAELRERCTQALDILWTKKK